jgi:hypothetical protein
MPVSTLGEIRSKVRKLTRSPSTAQLSDAAIDQYVNTFVIYDFPEHLRLFDLRTTLKFYTKPFVDVYETNTVDPLDPLYDFKNRYITIHPPLYIAGYQQLFSQSREQFFGIYPMVNSIASIGTAGDGITTNFAGILQYGTPVLQNNVLFSSIDINGDSIAVHDVPVTPFFGNLVGTVAPGANFINYVTGAFNVTFAVAPDIGVPINSQTVPYQPALPQAVLYYDDKFTLWPVPDQAYTVNLEAYIIPTELIAAGQSPDINQRWQYIAYGAAKKVFEDRMDTDSVQQITPEFKMQERLVVRKTVVQNTNDRTATMYTEQTGGLTSGGFGWGSGR